jgi:DNA mismatch endonuclease (patch repair protein)
MKANRRRDTSPEMAVRRLAHAQGLRYRVDARPLPTLNRRADLVFTRAKVAVFVDGCYWHGCRAHGTAAQTNANYWSAKIARNRERDADTNERLTDSGWLVLRAWEHEDPDAVLTRIMTAVRGTSLGGGRLSTPRLRHLRVRGVRHSQCRQDAARADRHLEPCGTVERRPQEISRGPELRKFSC